MFVSTLTIDAFANALLWIASALCCLSWLGELIAYRQTVVERYRFVPLVNILRKARTPALVAWAVLGLLSLALYPLLTASGLFLGSLLVASGVFVEGPEALPNSFKSWSVLGWVSGVAGMHHVGFIQGLPSLELGAYGVTAGVVAGFALLFARHHNGMRGFVLYKQG